MPRNVTYAKDYIRYVKSKKQTIFSHQEINSITQTIESKRLKPSLRTSREHLRDIKLKHNPNAEFKTSPFSKK